MGCFPRDFEEKKTGHEAFGDSPEKKRPININGQFLGTPLRWKTAPLRRPIKKQFSNNDNTAISRDMGQWWTSSKSLKCPCPW